MGCNNLLIIVIFFVVISNVNTDYDRRNRSSFGGRPTLSSWEGFWGWGPPIRQHGTTDLPPTTQTLISNGNDRKLLPSGIEQKEPSDTPVLSGNVRTVPQYRYMVWPSSVPIEKTTLKNNYNNKSFEYKELFTPFIPSENQLGNGLYIKNKTRVFDIEDHYRYLSEVNVRIRPFQIAMTVVILIEDFKAQKVLPKLNLMSAAYYNRLYRVILKHMSMIPDWVSGEYSSFAKTQQLWKKKNDYAHEFVPNWLQHLIPWVAKDDWKKEEDIYQKFQGKVVMKPISKHL